MEEGLFEFIRKITPETLQGWVSTWAALFKNTYVMRPDASDQVVATGLALATLFSIFCVLVFSFFPVSRLRNVAVWNAIAVVVFFCLCNVIRICLSFPLARETIVKLQTGWDYVTICFIFEMVMMMLFAIIAAAKAPFVKNPPIA